MGGEHCHEKVVNKQWKVFKGEPILLERKEWLKNMNLGWRESSYHGKKKDNIKCFSYKKNQYYRFWGIKYDVFRVGSF